MSYESLGDTLSMTEIIRLQDTLSKALVRRFEKKLALAFSDVAGSTTYFSKYGDEAGRLNPNSAEVNQLQQVRKAGVACTFVYQSPPRITREDPWSGPFGSTAGDTR